MTERTTAIFTEDDRRHWNERCLTWPETGCVNRVGEGLFAYPSDKPVCYPCMRRIGQQGSGS